MDLTQKVQVIVLSALVAVLATGSYFVGNYRGLNKGHKTGIAEQRERINNNFKSYKTKKLETKDNCIKRGKYKVLTDRCDREYNSQIEEIQSCEQMAYFPFEEKQEK